MRAEISKLDQLKKAVAVNKIFDELTGQMLSEKYVAWGTSLKSRKAVISIAPPGTLIAFNFRSLGYFVCTSRRVGRKLANARCDSALATMRKIRLMPNPHFEHLSLNFAH